MKRNVNAGTIAKQDLGTSEVTRLSGELSHGELDRVSGGGSARPSGRLFEVTDYSFDVEQVLSH